MGSSPITSSAPSPAFLAAFRARADESGAMTFARFMDLALYGLGVGYYRQDRERVGYAPGTDFFTASTSGPIFGELVAAACVKLLGDRDPGAHAWIEIGAEPGREVLRGVSHPFAATRAIRLGDDTALLDLRGPCVIFSNELFDAQPCERYVARGSSWRELGVRLEGDRLVEVELPTDFAGPPSPEGYVFDCPQRAAALTRLIARQPWTGLFVAFDYGKTLRELQEASPAGTVRAYYRHIQSNDLLARPGEQDLTCHVCWDWLTEALEGQGFATPRVESQEAFFVHHSARCIETTMAAEATRLSQRKLALMQLLHPAHLGQKFQVLHALR